MRGEFAITDMGGSRLQMSTTTWGLVCQARGSGAQARDALNKLCSIYWKPAYVWFRSKGLSNEDAKDLTQDLFLRAVEARDLFERADRERGSFRTFLFRRMRWAWIDYARRGRGGAPAASLDALGGSEGLGPQGLPDVEFLRNWARETVEAAQRSLADALVRSGREVRLRVFECRAWQELSVGETARRLGLDEDRVKNEYRAYKAALRCTLENLVRATVATDAEAQAELDLVLQYA